MIQYHDILGRLAANGWPTTRLQRERQISNGTIIQIRAGKPITTSTIDTICRPCRIAKERGKSDFSPLLLFSPVLI